MTILTQLHILIQKNFILQTRYWRMTLMQTIGAPIIFLLLLFLLQQGDYQNQLYSNLQPSSYPLQGVYECQGKTVNDPCINVLFSPNNQKTREITSAFASMNAKRTLQKEWKLEEPMTELEYVPTRKMGIVPVPKVKFIYDYALLHPNTTAWGIAFHEFNEPVRTIQYQIWYNVSLIANDTDPFGHHLISFQRGIDEAILSVYKNAQIQSFASIDVTLKDWPLIPAKSLSDKIVQNLGPVFFFSSIMILFIAALNQVVVEKESGMRESMQRMGLLQSSYWFSHFISHSWLIAIGSTTTTLLGITLKFKAFVQTDFLVVFLTFFLFGLGMLSLAYWISTFLQKSRTAIIVGIVFFIIGLLVESLFFSTGFIGYFWWKSTTIKWIRFALYLLPFFNFGKLFLDITTYTTGKLDGLTNTFILGPGFPWSALYSTIPERLQPIYGDGTRPLIPPPVYSMYFLLLDIVLYLLLTFYFDLILNFGYHPWFFLTSKFWVNGSTLNKESFIPTNEWIQRMNKEEKLQEKEKHLQEEQDVSMEVDKVQELQNPDIQIRIFNLCKTYYGSFMGTLFGKSSKYDKQALSNLYLCLEKDKIFVLLGQNGSGKTSLIQILSGSTNASQGDALIHGLSLRNQKKLITPILGVCSQNDQLYQELTAKEHVLLYAGLKNIPSSQVSTMMQERLLAVQLEKVSNQLVSTFSGGMKRRLSLILSTIGDPKVIFLDEPTTGMDPISKRQVWNFLEQFKKDKTIVLTTHSMEEADALGDRIGILSNGRLKAIGNSVSLKSKYGKGYRFVVTTDEIIKVKDFMKQLDIPENFLKQESERELIFDFPPSSCDLIPSFIRFLDSQESVLIRNWSISQTSLEQVFLNVASSTTFYTSSTGVSRTTTTGVSTTNGITSHTK